MFRIITDGKNYREFVLTKDGQGILFRPAFKEDFPIIKEFISTLSQETLRMRFMASISYVSDNVISGFCGGDFADSGCLLALTGEGENKSVIGLGNYTGMGNGRSAEVAFIISDAHQGKGIGSLLLERLAGFAAANGFIEFEAEVLPENIPMINVFKHSGFNYHQVWSSDVVHVEFPVEGAKAVWERAELREKFAVVNSLKSVLSPSSIAVIGASRDSSSIGNIIFTNIIHAGFKGVVFPVNPNADSINGVKAYSKIKELPQNIELAVIAVPADEVQKVAELAIGKGAKGLIVVTAGFAEAGEEGLTRQKKLVELVRNNGVRLLGPSCLGVMNSSDKISLNASLSPKIIPKGKAGFYSHSAALGLVVINYAKELGMGFTSFISAGNRADISGNDLLQYWEEDPDTKLAILYLETFGNPRKFVRIARRMSYKKPILCVKSAKSSAGKITIAKKSGYEVISGRETDALFAQTGIIKTDTLEELFDVAVVLSHQPLPKGNRVGVIANSAGMATIFADACENNGLILPENELKNLGAFALPEDYGNAVFESCKNNNIDSLLIGFAGLGRINPDDILNSVRDGIKNAVENNLPQKPILLCFMGQTGALDFAYEQIDSRIPSFRFPESAVRALGKIVQYVEFHKNPFGSVVWFDDVKADESRKIVHKLLSAGTTSIPKDKAVDILKCYGISTSDKKIKGNPCVEIRVKSSRVFGPLIYIKISSGEEILRITPLTESDLAEIFSALKLPENKIIASILGRVSQMIEELPWLKSLEINYPGSDEINVNPNVKMELEAGKIIRPEY